MGEEANWELECQVDLEDGTFIKPVRCSGHRNFVVGDLELKDTITILLTSANSFTREGLISHLYHFKPAYLSLLSTGLSGSIVIFVIGITANHLENSVAVCVGPMYVTTLLTVDLFIRVSYLQ